MNYHKSIIGFFIFFIFLFCIQICLPSTNNPYSPNLLLIFLTYALYQHQPMYQCFTILIGIEFLSVLQLGASGFNSIILVPLIVNFLTIKTFLHLKLLAPGLFILTYEIIYELFMAILLHNHYNFVHVCIKTTITYFLFFIMCLIRPTSFEKHKTI